MNDNTKIIYNFARMYEYVKDINDLCLDNQFNIDKILGNKYNKHAINMCLVQIGEHAKMIKSLDENLYYDKDLSLFQIKGMRDRITHSYGNIDYSIIKDVLVNGIPELKDYLEKSADSIVLQNPYILYEEEYEDVLKRIKKEHEKEIER